MEPAWSGSELGAAGAGPTQDPGKHFFKITMFIFFTQVSVLLQRKLWSLDQLAATQAPELAVALQQAPSSGASPSAGSHTESWWRCSYVFSCAILKEEEEEDEEQ